MYALVHRDGDWGWPHVHTGPCTAVTCRQASSTYMAALYLHHVLRYLDTCRHPVKTEYPISAAPVADCWRAMS